MSTSRRRELRKQFEVYDQTVDIVSCWEAVLNHSYDEEFEGFYFDRFPSIPQGDENPLTPDFTVFFNEKYGIIGEIKRTFPDGKDGFHSTIDGLANYDGDLPLENKQGRRVVPEICDIVLIISGIDAPQIGTRLQRIVIEQEEYNFSNHPVLIRFQYDQSTTQSRYDFQRVTELEFGFRDDPLPEDDSFSSQMGEKGDYGTLKVIPKYFAPKKIKKPLCNDAPPGQYLSTILWHKIFPEYLTQDEFLQWRMGTGQKTIPIKDSVEGITNQINEYIKEGTVKRDWVREALDFLCGAELAEKQGDDEYEIKFRGLVQDVGSDNLDDGTEFLDKIKELGTIFIKRYCEYTEEGHGGPMVQSSVEDFLDN